MSLFVVMLSVVAHDYISNKTFINIYFILLLYFFRIQTQKIFWSQYYQTFYVCNLQVLAISYSVCPLQAFQAKSKVFEKGTGLGIVKHLQGYLLYMQTLQLITNIC
jgi:hypothetical protein